MNRRELLQLISASALLPLIGGARQASATAAKSTAKLGLNLTGISYASTEQAFSNLAANASRWRLQKDNDKQWTWDNPLPPLTDDLYPKVVPPKSMLESFLIFTPYRTNLPVALSVYHDGKGKLGYLSGAELEARMPGYDNVRNLRNDAPFSCILLETDPNDPVRNIRVYERGEQPKGTFRDAFLKRMSGMSTLRFMDWMNTNNSEVQKWDDRAKVGQFSQPRGVALEHMVELCNITKADPWFNIPHKADDNYVRRFAQQVKDTLDPKLNVNVEYSNEVWNPLFDQARYADEQGARLGLPEGGRSLLYYAKRTSEILAIWEDVFGADKDRVIGIYASMAAGNWVSETILSGEGVKEHADVLAVAPYFGGSIGSRDRAAEAANLTLDKLFAELEREIGDENRKAMQTQADIAAKNGLKLFAYEGGQHLVDTRGIDYNNALTNLFMAANRDERMGPLYVKYLQNWADVGGDTFGLFSSMSTPSQWGSWGLLEKEGAPNPKWTAVQEVMQRWTSG